MIAGSLSFRACVLAAGALDLFAAAELCAQALLSINPGTNAPTGPPMAAISRTSRELT